MNSLKDSKPLFGVRTCATSANLGPGYDIAALALDIYNEYRVHPGSSGGFNIGFTGPYASVLDKEKSGGRELLAGAIEATVKKFPDRIKNIGKIFLDIEAIANIPPGKGLGSSASAAVAGVLVANKAYNLGLNKRELFQTAVDLESSPDNAAAALSGGLAIVYRQKEKFLFEKIELDAGYRILLMIPHIETDTDTARGLIPKKVPIEDAVGNISNFSLLVKCLEEENLDDASVFIRDNIHQKYRKDLYPGSAGLVEDLIDNWKIPAAISGAGPAVIAIMDQDIFDKYKSNKGAITGKYLSFESMITGISAGGSYYI